MPIARSFVRFQSISLRFFAAPTPAFIKPQRRAFHASLILRSIDTEMVPTGKRLEQLRSLMKKHEVDIYIVPSEDSHQSEYIAPCDARRAFICGFTGSAGTAVITLDKAALATDGRYFNQASKQLDENWTLLKQGLQDVPTWQEWAAEESEGGKAVGVDPTLITFGDAKKLEEKITKKGGKQLKAVEENLVDQVWGGDRPERPNEPVTALDIKYAGKSIQDKLKDLRTELDKKKSSGFIISMLDEIAWLYNLRGNDIPYNPVFFSYAAVTAESATLYVDKTKLDDAVLSHLHSDVTIKPYDDVFGDAESLAASAEAVGKGSNTAKFLLSNKASWALHKKLGGEDKVEETRSPVGDAKAIKNDVEVEGMRQCHIRDGAALIEFFAWLEEQLIQKKSKLDEVDVADKLEEYRAKKDLFKGLSFPTISSTGANAAVIHYKPEKGSAEIVDPDEVYLCDSGAQFYDGTTDTTRTIHFGEPKQKEKDAYTLVLKGHIALEQAVFPKGTSGFAIDAFARQFLWKEGLDYRHGTGHGVGSFLNVHEGPIGIGTRVQYSEIALSVGNVISNEPGFYEDNSFGIRIENVVVVREAATPHKFGDKPYLGFEHVTMVPMCQKLINPSMLTSGEKQWLNDYHAEIKKKTTPYFQGDERTLKWLEKETQPI